MVTRAVAATGEAEGDMDAVQRVVHGRQPHRLRTAQNQTLHQALVRMLVTHASQWPATCNWRVATG